MNDLYENITPVAESPFQGSFLSTGIAYPGCRPGTDYDYENEYDKRFADNDNAINAETPFSLKRIITSFEQQFA